MDILDELELFDCPLCHGAGLLEEENGWCAYVTCMDCGCHTAEVPYQNAEQREQAIRRVYASTMDVSALEYRRLRGLDRRDEQMAVLVETLKEVLYENV